MDNRPHGQGLTGANHRGIRICRLLIVRHDYSVDRETGKWLIVPLGRGERRY